jgi:hypothetical protein
VAKYVEIEDIEDMRRCVGVNDVELWAAIRRLRTGDYVRLTFTGGSGSAAETLRVRITRVRGNDFRGKLADRPVARELAALKLDSAIAFTASHIHSLAARPLATRKTIHARRSKD